MRVLITILFVIVRTTVSQPPCNPQNSVELTNRTYNGIMYEEGEYFVDNVTGLERGCVCMKEICSRKCCPIGQAYNMNAYGCVNLSRAFEPPVFERSELKPGFDIHKEFYLFTKRMNCSKPDREVRLPLTSTAGFRLRTDGRLKVTYDNAPFELFYEVDKYCLDNTIREENGNKIIEINGLFCYIPEEEHTNYKLIASCMFVSCFFIIVTVAVYNFLPELRTLNGMVVTAYLSSFFTGFLCLGTVQLLLTEHTISAGWCATMAFIIYFSLLAAFFWLNVMCFDIWWTFRITISSGLTKSKYTRFLAYCAYAFGVPAILTILLAALELSDLSPKSKWLPNLRQQGCFLNGGSKLLYLYTPILILCVANVVFFTLTALRIAHIKRQTQMLQRKDTQRFALYIKLFIVTGPNWFFEVISYCYPHPFWVFTDVYNVLLGVVFFILFICKKKMLISIKKRFLYLIGKPVVTNSLTTTVSSNTLSQSADEIQMKPNRSPQPEAKEQKEL
ncbi:putative G-protein coupled receptor Mth-like 3 isoform X2 [Anticarsia gemmatalis]|uniref:putative G-protein coupled receptor Mth-like 3 isoform X2 n=1 Tax=Anticarsia gemmatalis TaxID=129554 RepID=UPI003F778228